jgi:hypothetical protein
VIDALTKLVQALAAGKADGTVALVEACVKTIEEAFKTGATEGANDVRSGDALLLHIHYYYAH